MFENFEMNNEEQDNEEVVPELFDSEQAYTDQVIPLLDQITDLCKKLGVDYVFQLCYSHEHNDIQETCRHGVGSSIHVHGSRDPLTLMLMARVVKMEAEQAFVVLQVLDKIEEAMTMVKSFDERMENDETFQAMMHKMAEQSNNAMLN